MAEKKGKTRDRLDKISVIIPAYNVEDYIAHCIHTICTQSYENYEVIVVDDGSTDTTGKIIDELAKANDLIKPYHIKNRGLSGARNFGISKATGKYLAFVDGDDFLDRNFLSLLHKSLIANKADISVCGFRDIKESTNSERKLSDGHTSIDIINEEVPAKETCVSGKDYTIKLLTKQENLDIVVWNKLYLKSLFDDVKFPEGRNFEDNLTTYKVVSKAKKVSTVCESLYNHELRDGSIMNVSKTAERLSAKVQAAKDAMEFFKDDSSLFSAAEYSLVLAYFQFVDYAARGEIDGSYFKEYRSKILKIKNRYFKNPYRDKKRTAYIRMLEVANGLPYRVFRRK